MSIYRAYRTGIAITGEYTTGVSILSEFTGTGYENSTATCCDIDIDTGVLIDGFKVSGSKFDAKAINPYVSNRIRYSGTNHKGIIITENRGSVVNKGGSQWNLLPSTVAEQRNQPQIFANDMGVNESNSGVPTGQYLGDVFIGSTRTDAAPISGYWSQGSRLYTKGAYTYEGLICTVAGSPGTWKQFGSVQS